MPIETLIRYMQLCRQGDESVEERKQIMMTYRDVLSAEIADKKLLLKKSIPRSPRMNSVFLKWNGAFTIRMKTNKNRFFALGRAVPAGCSPCA